MATSEKIMLKNVRLSFPRLFEARAFQEGQEPRYEATFLLDPSDKAHARMIKEIEGQAEAIIAEKWGKKVPKKLPKCFGYADEEGIEYDGYPGMFFVRTVKYGSSGRPVVVDRQRNPITADDGVIYAGCYVNGTVSLWTQDNQFGTRINGNLRAVQFVRDGDAFGAAPVDPEDEFEALDEVDEDEFLD